MAVKKLIEVALPLEKINDEGEREKHITQGHPAVLHLWWARRPLAVTRAIIWSSLVDDPSSHPELYPTEEDQIAERNRLFRILEELVVWENSNDKKILEKAKQEIQKSNSKLPDLLDPFAGGGAIPLEGQRLGLISHAHDLNPVAVTINKAMIEIPARFSRMPSINPNDAIQRKANITWNASQGLASDIRYYGAWLKSEAYKQLKSVYPEVEAPQSMGGGKRTVIAWLWTRTVKCPNPRCGCNMPLASNFVISKKKGKEAFISPVIDVEKKRINYRVINGTGKIPEAGKTARGANFRCIACGEPTTVEYVRNECLNHRSSDQLMGMIVDGGKGKLYFSANTEQELAAKIHRIQEHPRGLISDDRRALTTPTYGMEDFSDLFTNRQLLALTTFSNLIKKAQEKAEEDAIIFGLPNDHISLEDGGRGAKAYGEAIGVYLAFAVDKLADYLSTICSWHVNNQQIAHTFGRQAIPMTWDYAEANPFSSSSGSFDSMLNSLVKCVEKFTDTSLEGHVMQFDAQSDCGLRNILVSTDPPYYDNIGYSDLSDYFYIWLRNSLKDTFPQLFGTMLAPKADELVAIPYRFNNDSAKAKSFFENGMYCMCKQLYVYTDDSLPVTIYYAYKQNDTNECEDDLATSTGWETMLSAIIKAGFSITGTWPVRTEKTGRLRDNNSNALATSIVLVCRKRSEDAPVCTRRIFIIELKKELHPALRKLQSSNIAPVDLAQSAIGPGMGVYSKYSQVLEADGKPMSVRSALKIINQELDLYFNEQDSDLDSETRFCVDLFSQFAFNEIPFGDANTLATAKNTSVAIMASHGILYAQKGKVHLFERSELSDKIDEHGGGIWLLCQQLTFKMEMEGVEGCAHAISNMFGSNAERAKDLAYRLYTIAEKRHWAQEAYAYNALVVAWPEIQSRAAELKAMKPQQLSLEDYMSN